MKHGRALFTVFVLGGFAVAFALRSTEEPPSRAEFRRPPELDLEPLSAPRGAHRLEGRLRTAAGSPASGAVVTVRSEGELLWARAGDDGRFAIDDLHAGEHVADAILNGHPPGSFRFEAPVEAPVEWTLPVPPPPPEFLPPIDRATLRGTVTGLSRPPAGYEVLVSPAEGRDPLDGATPRRASCDESGRFQVPGLVLGRYRVALLPPWAAGGEEPRLAELAIDHGAESPELVVEAEVGVLTGTVRESSGEPIADASILVRSAGSPAQLWPPLTSGDDGGFRVIDLVEGDYLLRVDSGDWTFERTLPIRPGELQSILIERP